MSENEPTPDTPVASAAPAADSFQVEATPQDEAEVKDRHESNRAAWNEGAQHYTTHLAEAIEFLNAGKSNLHPVERRNLGDLAAWCRTAIHLQCASGRDTLSLINEGVQKVIGVDISDVHIENARQTTAALLALGKAVDAAWYRCDVLDTPAELDGSADLVYTGRGAICWIQDLNAYAKVVARLLKPGGVYHIFDDHPTAFLFDTAAQTYVYSGLNYFEFFASSKGWPSTYIGDSLGIPVEQMALKYEAGWPLMDVFNALRQAGLTIEYLGEHPEEYWNVFPNLRPELRGRVPLTFSLLARKSAPGSAL